MSNITAEKPKGIYLSALLKRLGCSRTHFYTHYRDLIPVTKDSVGYRNIYLLEDVKKLEKIISDNNPIEVVKE